METSRGDRIITGPAFYAESLHRSGKLTVAEIYRRTLDGVAFFVDNETKAPVLMKESHPIASRVLIDTTLAENRDLSFAHPNLNEGGLDIEPLSDDSCIEAKGALFKLKYGHGLGYASKTHTALVNFERQPFRPIRHICSRE